MRTLLLVLKKDGVGYRESLQNQLYFIAMWTTETVEPKNIL